MFVVFILEDQIINFICLACVNIVYGKKYEYKYNLHPTPKKYANKE